MHSIDTFQPEVVWPGRLQVLTCSAFYRFDEQPDFSRRLHVFIPINLYILDLFSLTCSVQFTVQSFWFLTLLYFSGFLSATIHYQSEVATGARAHATCRGCLFYGNTLASSIYDFRPSNFGNSFYNILMLWNVLDRFWLSLCTKMLYEINQNSLFNKLHNNK